MKARSKSQIWPLTLIEPNARSEVQYAALVGAHDPPEQSESVSESC